MRLFVFGALSLALALGINLGEALIQHQVMDRIPILHKYMLAFHLIIPALAIAVLAYALGLWNGSNAVRTSVVILCFVVPPIASILVILLAVVAFHLPLF